VHLKISKILNLDLSGQKELLDERREGLRELKNLCDENYFYTNVIKKITDG